MICKIFLTDGNVTNSGCLIVRWLNIVVGSDGHVARRSHPRPALMVMLHVEQIAEFLSWVFKFWQIWRPLKYNNVMFSTQIIYALHKSRTMIHHSLELILKALNEFSKGQLGHSFNKTQFNGFS